MALFTSNNTLFDKIIDCGALFVWFFHYMPTGNDAVVELMPNPQQREKMYHQIRKFRHAEPVMHIYDLPLDQWKCRISTSKAEQADLKKA